MPRAWHRRRYSPQRGFGVERRLCATRCETLCFPSHKSSSQLLIPFCDRVVPLRLSARSARDCSGRLPMWGLPRPPRPGSPCVNRAQTPL